MMSVRHILEGIAEFFPFGTDPGQQEDRRTSRLRRISSDRLGDPQMVLLDMRRVMLRESDRLPEHERNLVRAQLGAGARFGFEERLGLGLGPDTQQERQLELFSDPR